jgi:hypothetical protein
MHRPAVDAVADAFEQGLAAVAVFVNAVLNRRVLDSAAEECLTAEVDLL